MHDLILPIIALVVIAIIVAVIKHLIPKGKLPYEKQPSLFTPAERSFLGVLEQAVSNQFRIMGKVRLGDIVKVKTGLDNKTRQSAFNRIQSKHVDFIACDPNDLSIQFAVELDDKSHEREDRQDRDAFVDKVMDAAGIPIIHFQAKRAYVVQEVRDTLIAKLNPSEDKPADVPVAKPLPSPVAIPVPVANTSNTQTSTANISPKCPSCGAEMVRRKAKSGQNAGNEFWGCSQFPKCRKMIELGQGSVYV
jgi:very-short-patch-repair endonuclease